MSKKNKSATRIIVAWCQMGEIGAANNKEVGGVLEGEAVLEVEAEVVAEAGHEAQAGNYAELHCSLAAPFGE